MRPEEQQLFDRAISQLSNTDVDADREFLFQESEKYRENENYLDLYGALAEYLSTILQRWLEKNKWSQEVVAINSKSDEKNWHRMKQSYTEQYVKPFEFDVAGKTISIKQKFYSTEETLGWTVWDGSLVLTKYLEIHYKDSLSSKRIVELGAGCGLVGLGAYALGAKEVVMTDMASVIELLKENVELNFPQSPKAISAQVLSWGDDVSHLRPPFDLVVAADVVYQCMKVDLLIRSLLDLSTIDTEILIAFESHDEKTPKEFNEKIYHNFYVEIISADRQDAVFKKENITLMSLKRKN
eukprot:TRINITY_DN12867_c0_g1_i1.p1 TRINITY_DN12867_c0_g1~~TRINITY_DN12867_c0_g1_i1.p1  ORF type:complete len:297 (+),score=129.54 TRINITY_DN12867_c0_g1_i1:33-923(+)